MTPEQLSETIVDALAALVADGDIALPDGVPTQVTVERPRQKGHGDYATNVALQLSKKAGTNPRAFADLVAGRLREADGISEVEVAGPGFLNITVAAGAASVAGIVVALIASAVGNTDDITNVVLGTVLLLGIGVFLYAMRWDSSDPARVTRRSDVAFWLHLLAAPMIVHPVFTLLGLNDGDATVGEGLVVIAIYVVLGIAALAIDRRALLVSALAYVLFALNELFEQFGAVSLNIALTALVIGSALLLLSAFWHQARAAVVSRLPGGLRGHLPSLSPQPA